MRKKKTRETTHKSDDYHTRTHEAKETYHHSARLAPRAWPSRHNALFPSLFPCRSFLLARCDEDPRKNAETHTGSQEAVNSSPATMYKQRRRRTRNEESAMQSAKWPAAEQELLYCAPCNSYRPATLQN